MSQSDIELDKLRAIDPRITNDFRERFERYTGEELEVISRADKNPRIDFETYVRDWVSEVLSSESPEATRSSGEGAGSARKG